MITRLHAHCNENEDVTPDDDGGDDDDDETHHWRNNNHASAITQLPNTEGYLGLPHAVKPDSCGNYRVAQRTAFVRHLYLKFDTLDFRLQRVL